MIFKARIKAASTFGILSLFLMGGALLLTGCDSSDPNCPDGFVRENTECQPQVTPVNSCAECDPNALCDETRPTCTCRDGYFGDGQSCEDINECATSEAECQPDTICVNREGSYACECDPSRTNCGGEYSIDLVFAEEVDELDDPESFRAAINLAKERWEELIIGDLPNVVLRPPGASDSEVPDCGIEADVIDDLAIRVEVASEDGIGGILAGASPICVRQSTDGRGLPATGLIRFDSDDLAFLQRQNILETIVLHEMGHVIGFGTLWRRSPPLIAEESCIYDDNGATTSCDANGLFDTRYIGSAGNSAWLNLGGTGSGVPLENTIGVGSSDTHWRESSPLRDELMSPEVSGRSPLSALTLRSLEDLGYEVANESLADPYSIDTSGASIRAPSHTVNLPQDILDLPIIYISTDGAITPDP